MNPPLPHKLRVLVVEDDALNRKLVCDLLRLRDVETIEAADGWSAVDRAKAERPDLIVMDIRLPRFDGVAAARLIHDDPACRQTPIVAVTAQAMMGDRERLLGAGFAGYFAKPIDTRRFVDDLLALLQP